MMRIKKTKILFDSSDEDISNGDITNSEKSHCSEKIESDSEDNESMSKGICHQISKKYVNKDDFVDNDSIKTGLYSRTKQECVYKEGSDSDEKPRKKKRVRLKSDSDDEYMGIGYDNILNQKAHGKCKKNKYSEHKDSLESKDYFDEIQGTAATTPVRKSSRIYQKDSAKGSRSLPDRRRVLDEISPRLYSTELKNIPRSRKRMDYTNNLIISRNLYNTERSYEMEDSVSEDDFVISDDEADSSEESEEEEHQERRKQKACKRVKKRKSYKREKKSKKIDSDSDENYSDASNIDMNSDKLDKNKKLHDSKDNQFDSISPISTKKVFHENVYKKVFPKRTKTKGYQKSLEKLKHSREGKKIPLDKTEIEETQDGLSSSDNMDLFNETNGDSDEDFIDDEGEDDWNIALKDIIDEWKNPELFKKAAATTVKKHKRLKFHSSSSEESNDDEGQNMTDTVKKFMHHVTENDIEAVKSLLVVHDLVNELGNNKQTALHIAAMQGLTPMVQLLLNKSADTNLVDKKNLTPLGHAALNKHPKCFELLLKKSNISTFSRNLYKDLNGINILHLLLMESPTERKSLKEDAVKCFKIVCSFNRKMFIRFLSQTDNRTPTPLMTAIMEDQVEVVKFILNHISGQSNECLEFKTDEGGNILHFAVQHSAGCLAELTPYVISVIDEQDIHCFTPLMYAAELGKDDCLEVLLNFNASVDVKDKDGVTALHLAAVSGNLKSIKLLLKFGHAVDSVDICGWPPLLYANFRANEECVIALFEKNPQQIFCLGKLMSDKDPEQREKNAEVIQQTLQSISHIDAYYSVFNDFIGSGDNISLLDKNDHGCFAKTWRVILSFKNKVRWLMRKHQSGCSSQLSIDRRYILESAIDQLHHSLTLRGMDVRFKNELGSCLGPKKEFCDMLTKALLIPERKLFIKTADEKHYIPSSNAYFLERVKEKISNLKINSRDKENNKSATNNKIIEPHEIMDYQPDLDISDEYMASFVMYDDLSNVIVKKCADHDQNVEINNGAGNLDTTIKKEKKPSKEDVLKKIGYYQKKLAVILGMIEFAGQFTAQVLLCQQIHISLQLSKPFIKQVLGIELNHREELSEYDHQLFSNIVNNNVDELELPFSLMAVNSWNGELEEILLGGKGNELITEGNKHDYLAFVSEFKLITSISKELKMFKKGFYKVIKQDVISIFNADEFALLLNGVAKIDISDWKKNTKYVNCSKSSSVITWFWSVVEDLIEEEKSLLLKFATGSPCVPAEGFSQLQGLSGINLFTIIVRKTDKEKLPEAATCFNTLTLPDYANEKVLREKLLISIRHGCEGFAFE